jgi:hypothetical protein
MAMATVAYSCDRTTVALVFRLVEQLSPHGGNDKAARSLMAMKSKFCDIRICIIVFGLFIIKNGKNPLFNLKSLKFIIFSLVTFIIRPILKN